MDAKVKRQMAVSDARRALILAAAMRLFQREGCEKISMREIAKEAGYTPGALYAYFSSKQELLVALLSGVLSRLADAVTGAVPAKSTSEPVVVCKGRAWLSYLFQNPLDRQLLMYFFGGGPSVTRGDGSEAAVMGLIRQTLLPLVQSPPLSAVDVHSIDGELDGILAQAVGLLLVHAVDPGDFADQALGNAFARYLQRVCQAHGAEAELDVPVSDKNIAQIDLFR